MFFNVGVWNQYCVYLLGHRYDIWWKILIRAPGLGQGPQKVSKFLNFRFATYNLQILSVYSLESLDNISDGKFWVRGPVRGRAPKWFIFEISLKSISCYSIWARMFIFSGCVVLSNTKKWLRPEFWSGAPIFWGGVPKIEKIKKFVFQRRDLKFVLSVPLWHRRYHIWRKISIRGPCLGSGPPKVSKFLIFDLQRRTFKFH